MSFLTQAENLLNNADIKETSKISHRKRLNILSQLIENIADLKDSKTIMKKLKSKYKNFNTRKGYVSSIMMLLREQGKTNTKEYKSYSKEISKISNNIAKEVDKNKYTNREEEKLIKWEDIKKIKPKTDNDILFYQFIVNENLFLRLKLFTVKLKNYNEDKDNYIKDGKLIMNDYKNVSSKGRQEFLLKKKTLKLIEELKPNEEYLFNITQPGIYITNFFNRYTGNPVNDVLLRKIYINNELSKNKSNSYYKSKANKMLNTLDMWNTNYKKIN